MRSYMQMMELVLSMAQADNRIRACYLCGSRVNESALSDQYSDIDITYIVEDIRPFLQDTSWIPRFGELLILQKPEDWHSHPYDYESREPFSFLMQFTDGNRIDLWFMERRHLAEWNKTPEPREVLLDKDAMAELYDIPTGDLYHIKKPDAFEFECAINEFWWLSLYAAKGLCRNEFFYAKEHLDTMLGYLLAQLAWRIGLRTDFSVALGKSYKYIGQYLTPNEAEQLADALPGTNLRGLYRSLLEMSAFFLELSRENAAEFGFDFDEEQALAVREYMLGMLGRAPL